MSTVAVNFTIANHYCGSSHNNATANANIVALYLRLRSEEVLSISPGLVVMRLLYTVAWLSFPC